MKDNRWAAALALGAIACFTAATIWIPIFCIIAIYDIFMKR